jgi:hypothetical protein
MMEVNRLRVLQGCVDEKIENKEKPRVLKSRLRSVCRMVVTVRQRGRDGVLHANRNKLSPRRVRDYIRKKLVNLALRKMGTLKASAEDSLDRCKVVWCKSYYINVRHLLSWVNRPLAHRSRERLK